MYSHKNKMIKYAASSIMLILLFIFACAGLCEHLILAEKHSHWILVRGTVEDAGYKDVDKRVGSGPLKRTIKVRRAWCSYSYIVDGNVYYGKENIEVGTLSHPQWGSGYGLSVYYNPLKPAESVIIRTKKSIPSFVVFLGLLFYVMMIWHIRLFFKERNMYLAGKRYCFRSPKPFCFVRVFSFTSIPKIIYAAAVCLILFFICLLSAHFINHGVYTTHNQEIAISALCFLGVFSLAGFLILLYIYYFRRRN